MNHNSLAELPANLFEMVDDLRIVDLSHNRLKFLPDKLFPHDGLESLVIINYYIKFKYLIFFSMYRSLDLSHNVMIKIPVTSISNIAALTICELDVSYNKIAAIHSLDLSNKFRVHF